MILKQGEVRKIGIEVFSETSQDFSIETAEFNIIKENGEVISKGLASIDDKKIISLFTAAEIGIFYCTFTYRIGPEILKAKMMVEVKE